MRGKKRIMLKHPRILGLAFASLLVASGAVRAGTIVESVSVGPFITDDTKILSLAQFDTMGGTRILDSVNVQFTEAINSSGNVENTSNTPADFKFKLDVDATLTGPSLAPPLEVDPAV